MDCLIGYLEQSTEGVPYMAVSVDCAISSVGRTKVEVAERLAVLLSAHLETCSGRETWHSVFDEEGTERLMGYAAEHGRMPSRVGDKDFEIGHGLRLRCYDLTA